MSDVFSIFMPGRVHWEEVKRAEKMLLLDARQGGRGPGTVDLDEGTLVLRDRTGRVTETTTDVGNPNRTPARKPAEDEQKSAADDIFGTPPAADQSD